MCDNTRINTMNPKFWEKVWQLQQTGSCMCSGTAEMEQLERAQEVLQRAQSHLVHLTKGDKAEHARQLMQLHAHKARAREDADADADADAEEEGVGRSSQPQPQKKRRKVNEAVYAAFCKEDDADLYRNMSAEIDKWRRFMEPLEPVENKPPPYVPPATSTDVRKKIARKWQGGAAPARQDSKLGFFISHFCTPQPVKGVTPRSSPLPSWQESPPEPAGRTLSSSS